MQPKISIVIPAFNEEKYLPSCLHALRKQTYTGSFEIIVVDNNSTDATRKIARSFSARVIEERQQGLIFAKQAGCRQAKGKLIAVLDADNIPPPHWLAIIDRLLENPRLSAVTGPYLIPEYAPWWSRVYTNLATYTIRLIHYLTKTSPHIWGGNVAFRKLDFEKIGGYDTRYSFAADEIKLRKDLQRIGFIRHDLLLSVVTSSRRFNEGPFYFFFEFLLKDYILNYFWTSLTHQSLKHPKNLRSEAPPRPELGNF